MAWWTGFCSYLGASDFKRLNMNHCFAFGGFTVLTAGLIIPLAVSECAEPINQTHQVDAYYQEIVKRTENGDIAFFARRWTDIIRIQVHGDPNPNDLHELGRVVVELNELIAPIRLELPSADANLDLHFIPVNDFSTTLPQYKSYNPGFHWVWWDDAGTIYRAVVLISTTNLSQSARNHIIREELTQSLGFLSDSSRYPDSIFYRGWSTTTQFSELDRLIIQKHYSNPPKDLPAKDRFAAKKINRNFP